MNTVKENSLNEEMSQTAAMFLRLVTEKLAGDSKLIEIENLRLAIANITGLQAELDTKQELVTEETGEIPVFDALGQIGGSGLTIDTFDSDEHLDIITENGFYSASEVVNVDGIGRVYYVLIFDSCELLFSDNGLWYRTFSTVWSSPRYIGGSYANITVTYAQAEALVAGSLLSPGAKYKITGHGQDLGIVLTAATSSEFETDGIRFGIVPAHYTPGTYDTNVWGGTWFAGCEPSVDEYWVYCGKVYKSKTGATGTATNWALNVADWLLMDPQTSWDYYTVKNFGVKYRFVATNTTNYPYGYIAKQWDADGNEFGEDVEPADKFHVDYNDWNLAVDGGTFFGNKLRRCYGIRISDEAYLPIITNNTGYGDIKNVTAPTYQIYSNTFIYNSVTVPSISSNSSEALISGNIISRTIAGDINSIVDSEINGNVAVSNVDVYINLSKIYANLLGNDFNGYAISWSTIVEEVVSLTFANNVFINQAYIYSKIAAAFTIGAGTFTIATGTTYLDMTVVTGCTQATDRSNGITVGTRTFTVLYTGWYRLNFNALLTASAACDMEIQAFRDATAITQWYAKSFNYGSLSQVILPDYPFFLTAGEVITVKYRHGDGGTVTFTNNLTNISLDYDN